MILGEAVIRCNGVQLKTSSGAKLNPGGFERKSHKGGGKIWGQSESIVEPYVECELVADEELDIFEINEMRDATITFEGNNGLSYMLTGCTLEKPAEISDEGKVSGLKWLGVKCKKQ